jgi:hypothetical protein
VSVRLSSRSSDLERALLDSRPDTATPRGRGAQDHPGPQGSPRRLWWIVAAFLAVQIYIIWCAANGPFVDEGLYIAAGMRVLEGKGPSDGYITWFNGSPFVWPVIAALGHRLGGYPAPGSWPLSCPR